MSGLSGAFTEQRLISVTCTCFLGDENDTPYLIGMQSFAAAQHGGASYASLPLDTLYEQPLIELP